MLTEVYIKADLKEILLMGRAFIGGTWAMNIMATLEMAKWTDQVYLITLMVAFLKEILREIFFRW